MLLLKTKQIVALEEQLTKKFENKMFEHIKKHFPSESKSEESIRNLINIGVKKATANRKKTKSKGVKITDSFD